MKQKPELLYGACEDCGACQVCHGKEWMILQQSPIDRTMDLVAPCLGCAGHKSLNQVMKDRGIAIDRAPDGTFYEATVN